MGVDSCWPPVTRTMRPWTRWWWLGSAVDEVELTRLLVVYRDAGLGGVEVTPIYGVQGQEERDIPYLSPRWLALLQHTLGEAAQLDMGVDMPTGTGWPFGGPNVCAEDAEDKLVVNKTLLPPGQSLTLDFGARRPQALAAFSENGESIHLQNLIGIDGTLSWTPPTHGQWAVYTVTQTWAGRMVKRAAPGGAGKCINPFSQSSVRHYLEHFDHALAEVPRGALRCQFHDSFEYLADWCPDLFDEFIARRGYDLRDHLPALNGEGDVDKIARVKTDYRETLSDLLRENFTLTWTRWAHDKGSLSRNQAHGSPGNLLDLYGTPDIPETEIFGGPGDVRVNKFASSAANVLGKPLISSETCTWLGEHFTVSLAQCKTVIDQLFTAGINHIFYHGTPYSPAEAAWPGWLFYASTTFTPDDPLWHDFPALNAYITRCQSLLQTGTPDNDVLLYWPLHDLWHTRPDAYMLEITGRWLMEEPVGQTAQTLWNRGFTFDYVSDLQLSLAEVTETGDIRMPGGAYKAVVVPPSVFMPETTLAVLCRLAAQGAMVVFENRLPNDVPGLGRLEERRTQFQELRSGLTPTDNLEASLLAAGIRRERIVDHPGLLYTRRCHAEGHTYFFANQGTEACDDWAELSVPFRSALLMDPMTGQTGAAPVRGGDMDGGTSVWISLPPGASIMLQTFAARVVGGAPWNFFQPCGDSVMLSGPWEVAFLEGGPVLPDAFTLDRAGPWTGQGNDAERFSGTARYTTVFETPHGDGAEWRLDLGPVADSARVRLDGEEIGILIANPFMLHLGTLAAGPHRLEIDVTNVAANYIRDMDRRGEEWRIFRDINFVDIHYKPFDASGWPIRAAGLLGPVRLTPMRVTADGREDPWTV